MWGSIVKCGVILASYILLGGTAGAQQQQALQPKWVAQGTVGVITGMAGGAYARIAADLTIDSAKLELFQQLIAWDKRQVVGH